MSSNTAITRENLYDFFKIVECDEDDDDDNVGFSLEQNYDLIGGNEEDYFIKCPFAHFSIP